MAYDRPERAPAAAPAPVDATADLAAWLGIWLARNGRKALPAPLPHGTTEAARFWLQVMFPCPAPPAWGADATANAIAWGIEARAALAGFLRLGERERHSVVRLVQDGVPYRGESYQQYIAICAETETMREDPATYRSHALAAARRVRPSLGQAVTGHQRSPA